MSRHYSEQDFTAVIDGERVTLFSCYTTDTRNGFCHTAVSTYFGATDTKQPYINRTWERFNYETVLKRAIEKLPKAYQQTAYDQIIERKAVEETKKAEETIAKFENLYNGLSDENKERLANSGIEIHSEADIKSVMGLMAMMTLMQK